LSSEVTLQLYHPYVMLDLGRRWAVALFFFFFHMARRALASNELGIAVSNRYTERDGPIGGGIYAWGSGRTRAIIDVAYPAWLSPKGARGDPACTYAWRFVLTHVPTGEPLFDGKYAWGYKSGSGPPVVDRQGAHPTPPPPRLAHDGKVFKLTMPGPGTHAVTLTEVCPLAAPPGGNETSEGTAAAAAPNSGVRPSEELLTFQGTTPAAAKSPAGRRRADDVSNHGGPTRSPALGTFTKRSAKLTLHFMAVRREIRSLFPEDRDRFLDAFASLWKVPTEEGRRRYSGSAAHPLAYLDVHDLNNVHRQNAGQRDADHFHEGVGFLTQHAKLSRRLEQSLQAIDPWLALPYWDTSIEMRAVHTGRLQHVAASKLWSPTFFGSPGNWPAKSPAKDFSHDLAWRRAAIRDGRWAFATVPRVGDGSPWGEAAKDKIAEGHIVPRNAYGYLRAPWNHNPSPYVSRFMTRKERPKWATCETIKKVLIVSASKNLEKFAEFWTYSAQFPPNVHAGIHDYVGGTIHEMDLKPFKSVVQRHWPGLFVKEDWDKFAKQWFILNHKGLWRSWLIDFPKECHHVKPPKDKAKETEGGQSSKGGEVWANPRNCTAACSDTFPREVLGRTLLYMMYNDVVPKLPVGGSWWAKRAQELPAKFDTSSDAARSALKQAGNAFCKGMGVTLKGENFEASGVLDPTFWLIHPTTDRLFQGAANAFHLAAREQTAKAAKSKPWAATGVGAPASSVSRGGLNASAFAGKVWPPGGLTCGSLADCLTCHGVDSWLSRAAAR